MPGPSPDRVADAWGRRLDHHHGLRVTDLTPIASGTATDNWAVLDDRGGRWFLKAYRPGADRDAEARAIEVSARAGAAGVPTPGLRPTLCGEQIALDGDAAWSLWEFVDGAPVQGRLRPSLWRAVGATVGRLHRALAEDADHPPLLRRPVDWRDLDGARRRFETLIEQYRARGTRDEFEAWAVDALRQRVALVPTLRRVLDDLPPLSVQLLHGDLSSLNVLARGDAVTAIIDFAPQAGFVDGEIARIGCDPVTVMADPGWRDRLASMLDGYVDQHPLAADDRDAIIPLGAAHALSSSYPLAAPLLNADAVDDALRDYGRARHEAAMVMLQALD